MSAVQVSCPGCGAAVVFPVGTGAVAVCPYCRSAVARGDRNPEDLGKVAAIVETGAVLKLGLKGRFDGVPFSLAGRTQMKHAAGGVWDEWYAAFTDGRWGWLAEAQGRYYMTFAATPGEGAVLPPFDDLQLEQELTLPGSGARLTVSETGTATLAGAEGEIPWRISPGATYDYADLTGDDGAFATLDYSEDPPLVFTGRQVTLDEISIPKNVRRETWELRRVAGRSLNCPHCGGGLELRAPDKTERLGCPHCGALLENEGGAFRFLTMQEELNRRLKPVLALGLKGRFGEDERTIIGILKRSVTFDRVDYYWDEYLLYHPRDGFEWLTHSDGHWNRVRNVPAGVVRAGVRAAEYKGQSFRCFQAARATVRAVLGECYWKVSVGEQVKATDYVSPPLMLSREVTVGEGAKEVNWSLGEYLTPTEVKSAFGLKEDLPRPQGVGPNQPFRYKQVYVLAPIFVAALLLLTLVTGLRSRTVYEKTFTLQPLPMGQKTQIFFSDKFELRGHGNVYVSVEAPTLVNGLMLEGDLVRDSDGHLQPFVLDMGYYTGTDDEGPWTEGSKTDDAFISSPGAGTYSLRLEAEPDTPTLSGPLKVKIEQGVARARNFLLALLLLLAIPAGVGVYHLYFVSQRWKDSEFSPFKGVVQSGGGDDD
ncbi:MAG: DUF4178 domain-containing protein [Gemmataceae bacterium]